MNQSCRRVVGSGLATGSSKQSLFLLLFTATALALGACAPGELGRAELPIVGGTRGGNPSVLWIYDARSGGLCTASLIAPRVVLTAKHCVQHSGESAPSAASSFIIGSGDVAGRGTTYRAQSVYTTPGVWTEGGRTGLDGALVGVDVAVIVLSREVTDLVPIPILRTAPTGISGRPYTAVGFGQIPSGSAGVKYTVQGSIEGVDRSLIYVGAFTCQGDSGGPMILESGEIAGVVSFGNGSCGSGYGAYNRIDLFMGMIDMALAEGGTCVDTGAEICDGRDNDCNDMVDETCTPRGEPCTSDDECVGNQCRDTVAGRLCAADCDARNPSLGCEDGFYCAGLPGSCGGSCVPARGTMGSAPIGAACTDNLECSSLFCTDPGDGRSRCLQPCEGDTGACAAGEVCATVFGACGACIDAALVSGARGLGEPCTDSAQCTSGMCFEDVYPARPSRQYCTESCTTDGECGERFHCRTTASGGICILGERSDLGDPCADNTDCVEGAFCAARGETRWCTALCDGGMPCRAGFECVAVGEVSVCVPDAATTGESCTVPDECLSGVCASGAGTDGGGACTRTCSPENPCPTGLECRRTADGTAAVCVWPAARPVTPPSGGGCTVTRTATDSRAPVLAIAALLLGLVLRRRGARR